MFTCITRQLFVLKPETSHHVIRT